MAIEITVQPKVEKYEIDGLPPGEYDLAIVGVSGAFRSTPKLHHISIPIPNASAPPPQPVVVDISASSGK